MRTILLGTLFFTLCVFVSAQTAAKVGLKNLGLGKISVSRGKTRAVINLTEETAGCVYPSGASKREFARRGCLASPASYQLIDAVDKDGQTYLVVFAEAMGNCNVCGQCGATESFALVWLKLDARLRVTDKKSAAVENCFENVSLLSPSISEENYMDKASLKFPFANDLLRVEFEKGVFGEGSQMTYFYSVLEYDRKTPEKGFVIKTEKREKSVTDEQ